MFTSVSVELARQSRGTFMVVMGTEYLAVTIVSVG